IRPHTVLTFARTGWSTGMECPSINEGLSPRFIDPLAYCGRLMCASLFECGSNVAPGGMCGAGRTERGGPGTRPDTTDPKCASKRTSELPRVHRAGDGWRTAAASRRASVPATGWHLAGHAEYARFAAADLHATATGDQFVSLPRAILLV